MIQTTNLPTNLRPNLIKKPSKITVANPNPTFNQPSSNPGPQPDTSQPQPKGRSLTSHLAKSTGRPNNDLQLRIHQVQTHGQDRTVIQPSWWLSRKKPSAKICEAPSNWESAFHPIIPGKIKICDTTTLQLIRFLSIVTDIFDITRLILSKTKNEFD